MCLLDRHDEHRRHGDECGTGHEDGRIDLRDWNAEGRRRLAVELGDAHDEAPFGLRQNPPDAKKNKDGGHDHEQLVAGEAEPRQRDTISEGRRHRLGVRTEHAERQLLDHEHQSDGGDDGGFGVIVDAPQQQSLGDEGQRPHG